MSEFFVRRPIVAMVIAIVIVILGLVSVQSLPIAQYPDITPPMVSVTGVYTGANATNVEESVATPIEQKVNGVENMIYMKSVNSSDGLLNLEVSFEVGTDLDLHLLHPDGSGAWLGSYDCYRANSSPDWGTAGKSNNPDLGILHHDPNPNPLTNDDVNALLDFVKFAMDFRSTECSQYNNWCDSMDINSSGNVDADDVAEYANRLAE